jgi:uncharacterized protein YidB (DUF937 family)
METTRDTKTLSTKAGYEVIYKSWISGGENNALQSIWLKDTKMSLTPDGKTAIEGFTGMLEQDAQKKLIEILVISVKSPKAEAPVTSNVVSLVEDMPLEDYNEVLNALNVVTGKKK